MTEQRYRGGQYGERMRLMTPEEQRRKQLGLLYDVASFAPVTGEAISAKEAKEYYDEGRYGMMSLAGLGALPLVGPLGRGVIKGGSSLLNASGIGGLLNKAALNTPTLIPDFYTKPIKGKINFLTEYAKSIPAAVRESVIPEEVARRRQFGISQKKAQEGLIPKEGKDSEFTAIDIARQLPETAADNALEQSIVGLAFLDKSIPIADVDRLASGIGTGFRQTGAEDIPQSIIDRATNHLVNGPHTKNKNFIDYEFQIKDPSVKSGEGYLEAVGSGKSAGATVVRMLRGAPKENYLAELNKAKGTSMPTLTGKDMVEFMQVSASIDNKAIRVLEKLGNKGMPNVIINNILVGRAKQAAGKEVKGAQKKALDSFNNLVRAGVIKMGQVRDEAGNLVSAKNIKDIKEPEGYLVTQQAFNSRQKELGGMNSFVVVDPADEKMYTMLSDGHDIMGVNPVGGKGLITAQPIIVSSIKPKAQYSNQQIQTRLTEDNIAKAVQDTEKATGIKKDPKETNLKYTLNALAQAKPTVTAADRRRARRAQAKIAGATVAGGGLLTNRALSDDE